MFYLCARELPTAREFENKRDIGSSARTTSICFIVHIVGEEAYTESKERNSESLSIHTFESRGRTLYSEIKELEDTVLSGE